AGHRGFSEVESGKYRNQPNWRIPIELKLNYPDLPLICDPSHICGKRDHIQAVCQEALDLLFEGLMIEVHPDPDHALSDNDQQLVPRDYVSLLASLKVKSEASENSDFQKQVATLREDIDKIDAGIVRLLAKRMKVAEEIGEYKKKNDVTVLQPSRINEIIQTRIAQGQKLSLSKEFIASLYELIHEEAVRHQEEVLKF
ncbi:MAG: bifunctional 3-deoxy-7-phosphoheptulonate synthase/chorismate mutase type II, partial [Victivallales bacterium]|nr:bifunctional 3-deoxy-7-phosphoheptulonate synthase/chorismate mutase type II [Victivallales bacterium]